MFQHYNKGKMKVIFCCRKMWSAITAESLSFLHVNRKNTPIPCVSVGDRLLRNDYLPDKFSFPLLLWNNRMDEKVVQIPHIHTQNRHRPCLTADTEHVFISFFYITVFPDMWLTLVSDVRCHHDHISEFSLVLVSSFLTQLNLQWQA